MGPAQGPLNRASYGCDWHLGGTILSFRGLLEAFQVLSLPGTRHSMSVAPPALMPTPHVDNPPEKHRGSVSLGLSPKLGLRGQGQV